MNRADGGFYPGTSSVLDKLERHTPRWKWPFWVWTGTRGAAAR